MMHPKPQSQSEQSGSNTTKSGLKRIGKGALSQRLDLEPWGAAWSGVGAVAGDCSTIPNWVAD